MAFKIPRRPSKNQRVIFDVLYGFIPITEWEERIISSPFFQRLRWIKQLGFAHYVFPGAEHNRFAHTIGVMHSMDQMIRALGLAVPDHELFDVKATNPAAMLHKSLRISALLHDIGTFPFSHAIEHAYIRHGNDRRDEARTKRWSKDLPNSHEHLGSYIIKNTNYDGGITRILESYGFNVSEISKIIKGDSTTLIANQLMHSDLDADRMDYLLRDSHYTGIKYGQFDRDYIMANLAPFDLGKGQLGFGVRENATHAIEDFLIARFSWYSQIIRNPGSAKFDIISSHIAEEFLRHDLIHQFQYLLTMIDERDERFFWWNDVYFMSRCQNIRYKKSISDPRIEELNEMLIYRKPPKTINLPLFSHRILEDSADAGDREKRVQQIEAKVAELQSAIQKYGKGTEWLVLDIPAKDVVFTRGLKSINGGHGTKRPSSALLRERDPIKVVARDGKASLLVERDNTLMKHLSGLTNFTPSVYANDSALKLLRQKRLLN